MHWCEGAGAGTGIAPRIGPRGCPVALARPGASPAANALRVTVGFYGGVLALRGERERQSGAVDNALDGVQRQVPVLVSFHSGCLTPGDPRGSTFVSTILLVLVFFFPVQKVSN